MRAATEFDSRKSLDRADLPRSEKLLTFPHQLLEPFEFDDFLERRVRCGVAILRIFRGVAVVVSELPEQPCGNSILHSYETIATRLHRERLGDVPSWGIRWFARYPSAKGRLESFYQIKFEWVPEGTPEGGFKRPRWRPLLGTEAARLVHVFDKEARIRTMLRKVQDSRKTHAFEQWNAHRR